MADNSAPSGADRPHARRPIDNERPSLLTMSEDAISRYKGVGSRIIEDLMREHRLRAEAAHGRHQENDRRYIEDLRREHRLRAEAAHARHQENARRAVEDLRRNRRVEDEERYARHQENDRRAVEDLRREQRLAAEAAHAIPLPTHNEPAPPGKPKGIPAEDRLTSPTATTPAGPPPPPGDANSVRPSTPPDPPQTNVAGKPSVDRQKDILAAINAAKMPLTRQELVEYMRLKTEGKLGANLAWMVKNDILANLPPRGYWPHGVEVPE